jgi:hypothetical protein
MYHDLVTTPFMPNGHMRSSPGRATPKSRSCRETVIRVSQFPVDSEPFVCLCSLQREVSLLDKLK